MKLTFLLLLGLNLLGPSGRQGDRLCGVPSGCHQGAGPVTLRLTQTSLPLPADHASPVGLVWAGPLRGVPGLRGGPCPPWLRSGVCQLPAMERFKGKLRTRSRPKGNTSFQCHQAAGITHNGSSTMGQSERPSDEIFVAPLHVFHNLGPVSPLTSARPRLMRRDTKQIASRRRRAGAESGSAMRASE